MSFPRIFAALLCAICALPALSHEFWIAPLDYQTQSGDRLQAHFRNGEEFEGITLSYFDRSSARFVMITQGKEIELTPRSGDSPALDVTAPVGDSLVVVAHETAPSRLTYKAWEKFLKFAAHKDFPNAATDHIAAGWSQDRFRESYTRHAKALIAVGSGSGADRAVGMATEFVALTNPYEASFANEMLVQLLLAGKPRPDAQVEVFARSPDGAVSVTLHRTGPDGIASIPVKRDHEYLFDAVTLRPFADYDGTENSPVWETLWAALTFKVPR